ncbi:MAG: C25 family cysteine peptidase [Marinicellaceae bacterium]
MHICGDNGSGFGFSIADANGDEVNQFSNSSGIGGNGKTPSLYEPSVAGDCGSTITTVVFSHGYDGGAENNGEPYLRCFTDGTSPLDYYRNVNGDFAVPTPGAANCTVSTPVYINQLKHSGSLFEWQAGLEFNHIGYNVYSINKNNKRDKINSEIIRSQKSQNYEIELYGVHQNQQILLTAVDIFGHEQKLDYIDANQQMGVKEKTVSIKWPRQVPDSNNQLNKSHDINQLNIFVEQTGIQKIKIQDLLTNGLDLVGLKKTNVLISKQGEAVSHYIKSSGPIIKVNDIIVFFGTKADSLYSNKQIYSISKSRRSQLIKGVKANPRINAHPSSYFMTTEIFEENNSYEFTSPNNDPWIMQSLLAFDQSNSETWLVDLPYRADNLQAINESVTIAASINGVTDFPGEENDHHIELIVNNQSVAQYFDGQEDFELVNIQSNTNLSNPLEIKLNQPADTGFAYDLVNLDKFTLTYPRTFESEFGRLHFKSINQDHSVSGFASKGVIILAKNDKGTFLLEGAATTKTNGLYTFDFYNQLPHSDVYISQWNKLYEPQIVHLDKPKIKATDLLIVTQDKFIPYLSEYINQKESQGLKTMAIDVNTIYAHFGNINQHPEAIKTYINTLNLKQPLSYVMIVGSDQYDYKNYLDSGAFSIVPTFYRNTGNGINHAPTDVPFVDFNNDNIADIPIGRLTVNSSEELINVVHKLETYQNTNHDQELFVTDNIDAENFIAIADELSQISTLNFQHINAIELGVEQAKSDLIAAINDGADLVNWIGHSSASRWSRDNIFDISDVDLLNNSPAVFFQLGCWNSYFVDPINQTLANSLLQKQDFGAVATIGSSTFTKTDGEKLLALYYKSYLNENKQATIGQAFNFAIKKYAASYPERLDILLGYQLLGDPTMVVN